MGFDALEHSYSGCRRSGAIRGFTVWVAESRKGINGIIESCYKASDRGEGSELEDMLCDLESTIFNVGFAFGYAIGQTLDTPYPEIRKDIEAMQKILKREKLLPYLPRERKPAATR